MWVVGVLGVGVDGGDVSVEWRWGVAEVGCRGVVEVVLKVVSHNCCRWGLLRLRDGGCCCPVFAVLEHFVCDGRSGA